MMLYDVFLPQHREINKKAGQTEGNDRPLEPRSVIIVRSHHTNMRVEIVATARTELHWSALLLLIDLIIHLLKSLTGGFEIIHNSAGELGELVDLNRVRQSDYIMQFPCQE